MKKSFIFKMVWRGWFVGATAIFTPLFLLAALFAPDAPKEMAFAVLLVPFIAALQGVMFGGLVVLGLTIWPPKSQ